MAVESSTSMNQAVDIEVELSTPVVDAAVEAKSRPAPAVAAEVKSSLPTPEVAVETKSSQIRHEPAQETLSSCDRMVFIFGILVGVGMFTGGVFAIRAANDVNRDAQKTPGQYILINDARFLNSTIWEVMFQISFYSEQRNRTSFICSANLDSELTGGTPIGIQQSMYLETRTSEDVRPVCIFPFLYQKYVNNAKRVNDWFILIIFLCVTFLCAPGLLFLARSLEILWHGIITYHELTARRASNRNRRGA